MWALVNFLMIFTLISALVAFAGLSVNHAFLADVWMFVCAGVDKWKRRLMKRLKLWSRA